MLLRKKIALFFIGICFFNQVQTGYTLRYLYQQRRDLQKQDCARVSLLYGCLLCGVGSAYLGAAPIAACMCSKSGCSCICVVAGVACMAVPMKLEDMK